jgi:hypothetical protein
VSRRLHAALAELAQIAGFAAFDLDDQVLAQKFYLTGLRAAHAADDRPLGANILKFMAGQAAETGRPHDAVMLADSALAGTRGHLSAAQEALLHTWRGYAYAIMNDEPACEAAVSRARHAADRMADEDRPPWLYWVRPADIDAHAGDSMIELGRLDRAQALLRDGIAALPADRHLGDQQLYLVRLATAQARSGEADGAVETADGVLALAGRRTSPRSRDRIRDLHRELRPYAGQAPVRDLLERCAHATAGR